MMTVSIARDFTSFPAGRRKSTGSGSGEEFRDRFLLPAIERGERIRVELDGASGYPPSFLEEAFGGLVRLGYSGEKIFHIIDIVAGPEYETYKLLIEKYVAAAELRERHGRN